MVRENTKQSLLPTEGHNPVQTGKLLLSFLNTSFFHTYPSHSALPEEFRAFDSMPCQQEGFPGGSVIKNPPDNAGDPGSIPGSIGKIP